MALTNAERQKRWREKRNEEADTITGRTPKEIAEKLLSHFGVKDLKRVMRAADKRLRNIKPDCPACEGTGYFHCYAIGPCNGLRESNVPFGFKCECSQWEGVDVADMLRRRVMVSPAEATKLRKDFDRGIELPPELEPLPPETGVSCSADDPVPRHIPELRDVTVALLEPTRREPPSTKKDVYSRQRRK